MGYAIKTFISDLRTWLNKPVHIAPLAVLRILFGAIMLISTLRFVLKGWVYEFYVMPKFYFPVYGFEWVKPLGEVGMYTLFAILSIASLFVMLGLFYKLSITAFFLCFTYVELIDKTNYLNHYYFISVISFLLILVPAHRYFSIDVLRNKRIELTHIPNFMLGIFKVQLSFVYFFAGLAKLNPDWLFKAMPLKIWLPANAHLPVIGSLLDYEWTAYLFSWFGALYDLTIPYFLFKDRTRPIAYLFVILFHLMTAWFFPIGMFPFIMILLTVIFFSENIHTKIIGWLSYFLNRKKSLFPKGDAIFYSTNKPLKRYLITSCIAVFFIIQLYLPFRYLLYPGRVFWTEEGYRFSWRVMLMEKAGTAFFYVQDTKTGKKGEVINSEFLTPLQEKMMATQPDMILQYAHYLEKEYKKKGIEDPSITVESYVTLNGSGSQLFIDSSVDLTREKESFLHKKWILPFNE